MANTNATRKKMRARKRLILTLAIITVLIIGLTIFALKLFKDFTPQGEDIDPDETGVVDVPDVGYTIRNIALFGVDSRSSTSTRGLSDTIVIVSIDEEHNTVKLTSILRDTYAPVEGYGWTKINSAYSYGGPTLAIKTLNQNFKLDITDYATVNFSMLSQVVDALGGVDIEITDAEQKQINFMAADGEGGLFADPVQSSGLVHLNGVQALCYSRIRQIDSDVNRSGRQRVVIEALLASFRKLPLTKMPGAIKEIVAMVDTSLNADDIAKYIPMAVSEDLKIEEMVIPGDEDNAVGVTINEIWYFKYDLDAAATRLREYIYGTAQ